MARTVDHIAGGRLILGLGAGWFERDFLEYGYSFGDEHSRLREFDRTVPVVRGRLAALVPSPVRRIPILIGGGGERVTLRIVAQNADMWHWFGTPEELARKSLVLDAWCEKVSRDPGTIEHLVGLSDEYGGAFDPGLGKGFLAAGARQLTFKVTGPDYDLRFVKDWVSWRDEMNNALPGPG